MQYREQGVAILFYFRPLVSGLSILNRERVQAERLLHAAEFGRGGIVQRDPHEAIGPLQIVGDLRQHRCRRASCRPGTRRS